MRITYKKVPNEYNKSADIINELELIAIEEANIDIFKCRGYVRVMERRIDLYDKHRNRIKREKFIKAVALETIRVIPIVAICTMCILYILKLILVG